MVSNELHLLCYMYLSNFLRGFSFNEAHLSGFIFEKNSYFNFLYLFIIQQLRVRWSAGPKSAGVMLFYHSPHLQMTCSKQNSG